ncbi:MAG: polyamine ABC transporter substrate-binding protein, partial [Gammaproteobacteria bacterium]|nr:polyamine ABC transporter substrate-binding protein [Gammaproteobacteria bacterium]
MSTDRGRCAAVALAVLLAASLAACGGARQGSAPAGNAAGHALHAAAPGLTDAEKVLNVYNWSDYISPDVVPAFEKEYGIKVNYDVFDSNAVLQTKLLAGQTGYDIVVPSANFLALQIKAGVFQKLDKSRIPNLKNVDPDIAKRFAPLDPGMQYAVNYFWGTSGVGYNVDKIKAAMPAAPVDSFRMFYDPAVVRHFKDCGISILDEPEEIINTVFVYLGIPANSERPEDLAAAEKVLMAMRPYVRYVNSSRYIEDLANGDICLALGWSGDVGQAGLRAREARNGNNIKYLIPQEGAVMFFDMLAIPADALHPNNAHLFINYLLRPDVSAKNSSAVHFASSNAAAYPLI